MITSPIIQAKELIELQQQKEVILIDASSKAAYLQQHLKGALWVDLNTDLSAINEDVAIGGRHPLPNVEQFLNLLGRLGITASSSVVVYDNKNGSNAAARFWWMLKAVGHEQIQVLNGGFDAAVQEGYLISNLVEKPTIVETYKRSIWQLPIVNLQEVEKASQDNNYLIIDVREATRYEGKQEPIDLIAGHIPNAINIPFVNNLDEDGLFKTAEQLREQYQELLTGRLAEKTIVHCGSGVTACHTLLAIAYAGLDIPSLYVGSWSEWSRNGKSIVTI